MINPPLQIPALRAAIDPKWHEISVSRKSRNQTLTVPDYAMDAFGLLEFNGKENLFAIDGQHRAKGIEFAIKDSKDLSGEEIPLLFVGHQTTPEGKERTRRFFTRLNKYAKVVSKAETIALDEDDICAIITRRLVEKCRFFANKISITNSKSLSQSNKHAITTISVLYDSCDLLLHHFIKHDKWSNFKKTRPSHRTIDRGYRIITDYFDKLASIYPELREGLDANPLDLIPGKYRGAKGGSLLYRPIGILILTRAISRMLAQNEGLDDALRRLAENKIPSDLSKAPWDGLLWNTKSRRMITAPENQKAAVNWILWRCGHLEEIDNFTEEDLRIEIANLANIEVANLNW